MLLEPWCTLHSGLIAMSRHPVGMENIFWSFLTKTKQDQALSTSSHVHGKIVPSSIQFWLSFFLFVTFSGHPVYQEMF